MSGIVFNQTSSLSQIKEFYEDKIGMELWLDQGGCIILKHGNMLLGFCAQGNGGTKDVETSSLITFFYPSRDQVHQMHAKMGALARAEPAYNPKYRIFHFYAQDPEGRELEFQAFEGDMLTHMDGQELLVTRRSIREYRDMEVHDELLDRLFEDCRYLPTACNSHPHYFIAITDRKKMEAIVQIRGEAGTPIVRAPMAVAICSNPGVSSRHIQDGCIAAYHFTLAAHLHGLGTCWIADLDRDEVKDILGIPRSHYVATVTPLGYPDEQPMCPPKKGVSELVQHL